MITNTSNNDGLLLRGLDGSNPLAFLAALGTLRVLTHAWPERNVKMAWAECDAAWRPKIYASPIPDQDEVATALSENLTPFDHMFSKELIEKSKEQSPIDKNGKSKWSDKLRFPIQIYFLITKKRANEANKRERPMLDFMASWATDAETEEVEKHIVARRTRFDFTAGNQAFISMMREVRDSPKEELKVKIESSLFSAWQYSTNSPSLRWDPVDEKRQYALQFIDPTNTNHNPINSEPGANILAIEAFPFFPFVPTRKEAQQPGFNYISGNRSWFWPIWIHAIPLNVVFSLLTLPYDDNVLVASSRKRGVVQVYRSWIVQPSGRYRNFTPAEAL